MKTATGKTPWHLVPWEAMEGVALAMEYGAKTYEPWDWLKGAEWSLYFAAVCRHIFKWFVGEDCDPKSGLHHLYHAIAGLLILITYIINDLGADDRPTARYRTEYKHVGK